MTCALFRATLKRGVWTMFRLFLMVGLVWSVVGNGLAHEPKDEVPSVDPRLSPLVEVAKELRLAREKLAVVEGRLEETSAPAAVQLVDRVYGKLLAQQIHLMDQTANFGRKAVYELEVEMEEPPTASDILQEANWRKEDFSLVSKTFPELWEAYEQRRNLAVSAPASATVDSKREKRLSVQISHLVEDTTFSEERLRQRIERTPGAYDLQEEVNLLHRSFVERIRRVDYQLMDLMESWTSSQG